MLNSGCERLYSASREAAAWVIRSMYPRYVLAGMRAGNSGCGRVRSGGPEPRREPRPRLRAERQDRAARVPRVPHAHDRAVLADLGAGLLAAVRGLPPPPGRPGAVAARAGRALAPGRDLRAVAVRKAVRTLTPVVHAFTSSSRIRLRLRL